MKTFNLVYYKIKKEKKLWKAVRWIVCKWHMFNKIKFLKLLPSCKSVNPSQRPYLNWNLYIKNSFLAHLSTKCSRWAFVMAHCPSSIVCACVRACVNNFFKKHLLWNHLMDFDQTSQEWSLGGPLSKLFKPFQFVA